MKITPTPTDVALVDVATGEVLHVLKSYGQWVCRLTFSPDGTTLAVGESSGKIRLWNVAAGRLLLTLPGHDGSVNGLAFHPGGRVLASCSDTEIRLWRAATDQEVARRGQQRQHGSGGSGGGPTAGRASESAGAASAAR